MEQSAYIKPVANLENVNALNVPDDGDGNVLIIYSSQPSYHTQQTYTQPYF